MAEEDVSLRSLAHSAVFVACLWIGTLTFGMPLFILLVLFQSFRAKFYSFIFTNVVFTKVGNLFPRLGANLSGKLFNVLEKHRSSAKQIQPPRFLEIGVGDGANFSYYPENCSLTLLDMNPNFEPYVIEKLKKFPHLNVENILITPAEDMKGVPDNSFDVVVSTHCLCSVSDPNLVLKEVHRVLKPGGNYAFFDHIAFKENSLIHLLQKVCNPLWKVYTNGCCLDRDIESMVERHFANVSSFTCYPKYLPALLRANVIGIASK